MDLNKTLDKLDKLFADHRSDLVEDFLQNSIKEAMTEGDNEAILSLVSELVGFYRDSGQADKAASYAGSMLRLCESFGISGTVPHGTALLNAANAYRAAGMFEQSAECFGKCFEIYSENLPKNDMRISGYYNNLSLLYQEMGDFSRSVDALKSALAIAEENSADYEIAAACSNLSASLMKLGDISKSEKYADRALEIFERDPEDSRDFHYSAALAAKAEILDVKGDKDGAGALYEHALTELHLNTGYSSAYVRLLERYADFMERCGLSEQLKGMYISREYFNAYGGQLLNGFEKYLDKIAVGLMGEGSDILGYDDISSHDHDFGAGFGLFVSRDTYNEIGAELQAAYDRLPKYFRGIPKAPKPLNGVRRGVIIAEDFFRSLTGLSEPPSEESEWLFANEYGLAAVSAGEIFRDDGGNFTRTVKAFRRYYPEDIRRKKLAMGLTCAAQSGQYNYLRAVNRGDTLTAELMAADFVQNALYCVFPITGRFAPITKWRNRAADELGFGELTKLLSEIMVSHSPNERAGLISKAADMLVSAVSERFGINISGNYLEDIGKELMNMNRKAELAEEITQLEWNFFDKVKNIGGRASCQDDFSTFEIMRKSQYLAWSVKLLECWRNDLLRYETEKGNPITLKYAYMMEHASPEEFAEIRDSLPPIPEERRQIINSIAAVQVGMMNDFAEKFPKLAANARSVSEMTDEIDNTSYETYLKGELAAYSPETLLEYGYFISQKAQNGENLVFDIMENTVEMYGYSSLEAAEEKL